MRIRVNFPFFAATGTESSAVVYFEIEPGHYLGTHTDSAEEIVLILAGTVEASLGEETGVLSAGTGGAHSGDGAAWGPQRRRRDGALRRASSRRPRWSRRSTSR